MDSPANLTHMYTRDRMERNLGVGNIAEAFFRAWWEAHMAGQQSLLLGHFGYNPDGLVVGKDKADMLKSLPRSPDFAIFRSDSAGTPDERPLLGISINNQKSLYSMDNARSPRHCLECPRNQDCYRLATDRPTDLPGNLWYNLYNITNDYVLFSEAFEVDVLLVTIVSTAPNNVWAKVKGGEFKDEVYAYLTGQQLGGGRIDRFREYLLYNRGNPNCGPRDYSLFWTTHSQIHDGVIPYSIAGAPVNQGRPRSVACIDVRCAHLEPDLPAWLAQFS